MPIATLRVCIARRHCRVLFSFDDKPTMIAVIAQSPDQRREVDCSVAWHREGTVDHSIEETPLTVARDLDNVRPNVLEMNMANACDMPGEHIHGRSAAVCRLAAAECCMTAIKQQADVVA